MEVTPHARHIRELRIGLVLLAILAWAGGTMALLSVGQAAYNSNRAALGESAGVGAAAGSADAAPGLGVSLSAPLTGAALGVTFASRLHR